MTARRAPNLLLSREPTGVRRNPASAGDQIYPRLLWDEDFWLTFVAHGSGVLSPGSMYKGIGPDETPHSELYRSDHTGRSCGQPRLPGPVIPPAFFVSELLVGHADCWTG